MKVSCFAYWVLFIPYIFTLECEDKINYFTNIINRGRTEALLWKYPTRNTFFGGYNTSKTQLFGTFDFIIVGGGTAGSILARRLSKISEWKILLIEAGFNETDFSLIPRMYLANLRTDRNWGYKTTPQANACKGCVNNQCDYPRGKNLGGSSGNNAMLFVRGNSGDFQDWTDATGTNDWSYKNVLPYFKKLETSKIRGSDWRYRGHDGPIYCTFTDPISDLTHACVKGNEEEGYHNIDYNGMEQIGVSPMQSSIKSGIRDSTNQGYLQPIIKERENLVILTTALATKVIFERKTAVGVEFLYNAQKYRATKRREIILSAGAINTPQLLMLSGVGPKSELDKFDIPIVQNLPVGQNFEDHLALLLTIPTNTVRPIFDLRTLVVDYFKARGALTNMDVQGISYFANNSESTIPDIEFLYTAPGPFSSFQEIVQTYNLNISSVLAAFPTNKTYSIVVLAVLLHPISKGQVTLNTTDALDFPLINPNYLTAEDDLAKMYEAIRELQTFTETSAMQNLSASLFQPVLPTCKTLPTDSREYWYCVTTYMASTLYHPVSTCRMGKSGGTSVVDEDLRIHGLEDIRVIDASVIPASTSGHPNIVVAMIAEKMADKIRNEYDSDMDNKANRADNVN